MWRHSGHSQWYSTSGFPFPTAQLREPDPETACVSTRNTIVASPDWNGWEQLSLAHFTNMFSLPCNAAQLAIATGYKHSRSRRTASSLQLVCHALLPNYFRVQQPLNPAIQLILCRFGAAMCPPAGTLQAQNLPDTVRYVSKIEAKRKGVPIRDERLGCYHENAARSQTAPPPESLKHKTTPRWMESVG